MGIVAAENLAICKSGWFAVIFALAIPLFNGCLVAFASQLVTTDIGNRFILAILASASYIAVPVQ
jgi:hypothetical protein